jgi:hypothetical protein
MNGLISKISYQTAICVAAALSSTLLLGILLNAAFNVTAVA